MSDEWFDVAHINSDEAILFGQLLVPPRRYVIVRKELSETERWKIEQMNERHRNEMGKLLRSMAE